jgi:hypothetical protein
MATTLYRVLTGPDDAQFCHRVSDALSRGWQLYGAPSLAFDSAAQRMMVAQAITKMVADDYSPDMKLSEQ